MQTAESFLCLREDTISQAWRQPAQLTSKRSPNLSERPLNSYPLTEPAVRPAMNSFWSIKKRTKMGAMDTSVPAINMP